MAEVPAKHSGGTQKSRSLKPRPRFINISLLVFTAVGVIAFASSSGNSSAITPVVCYDDKGTAFRCDPDPSVAVKAAVAEGTTLPQCEDGKDNDGDGLIDWPDDPGCYEGPDNDEYNSPAPAPPPPPVPAPPPPPPVPPPGPSQAPINDSPPSYSGATVVGQTLTGYPGVWHNPGSGTDYLEYDYQWLKCDAYGSNCSVITGANSQLYIITSGDLGATLRFMITAYNSKGSAQATSAPTSQVQAPAPPPTPIPPPPAPSQAPINDSPPSYSGDTVIGSGLIGYSGVWHNPGNGTDYLEYDFQWQRCSSSGTNCLPITGANNQIYTLTQSDLGSRLKFHVNAFNSRGSAIAVSQLTPVVTAPPATPPPAGSQAPINDSPPSISGQAEIGKVLTASPGVWHNPVSGYDYIEYDYNWQHCDSTNAGSGTNCYDIAGANTQTYAPRVSDSGYRLRVRVTAYNSKTSTAATSLVTAIVQETPTPTPPAATSNCNGTEGVYLYEGLNFTGRCSRLTGDVANFNDLYVGNDSVSSVRLVGAWNLVLYEHANYIGLSQSLTADSASSSGWTIGDNNASSASITRQTEVPPETFSLIGGPTSADAIDATLRVQVLELINKGRIKLENPYIRIEVQNKSIKGSTLALMIKLASRYSYQVNAAAGQSHPSSCPGGSKHCVGLAIDISQYNVGPAGNDVWDIQKYAYTNRRNFKIDQMWGVWPNPCGSGCLSNGAPSGNQDNGLSLHIAVFP